GIALVTVKAVLRELGMQALHLGIAVHLGDDRRGADARHAVVAADDGFRRHAQFRAAIAVDAHEFGNDGERLDRPAHGQHGRLQDIERVDLRRRAYAYGPGQRAFADDEIELLAPRGVELLGI